MGGCFQVAAVTLAGRRPVRSTRASVNYAEPDSSSSEDFEDVNSTFEKSYSDQPNPPVSPSSPLYLLQPSQPETNEVLDKVVEDLRVLESINKAASELPRFPSIEDIAGQEEEDQPAIGQEPVIMVNYDMENKEDGEDYYKCVGLIKLAWDPDPNYWFNSIEASLRQAQVFSQWTKREILQTLLPDHVREEVRYLLRLPKDEAGDTPYKDIKDAIDKRVENRIATARRFAVRNYSREKYYIFASPGPSEESRQDGGLLSDNFQKQQGNIWR